MLDKAIWRRFDRTLIIEMPEVQERKALIERHLDGYQSAVDTELIDYLARSTSKVNSADICKLCEHIKRQFILSPELAPKLVVLSELLKIKPLQEKDEKISICKNLRNEFSNLTQRDIAQITQIPLSTVSRYLSKE